MAKSSARSPLGMLMKHCVMQMSLARNERNLIYFSFPSCSMLFKLVSAIIYTRNIIKIHEKIIHFGEEDAAGYVARNPFQRRPESGGKTDKFNFFGIQRKAGVRN